MLVALQLVGVAAAPLKVTVLVPWAKPKPVPVIVTDVSTGPEVGLRLVMFGATLKGTPLLGVPPTKTTTLPEVAPEGTGTTIVVGFQLVIGNDCVLLNATMPGVAPNPV